MGTAQSQLPWSAMKVYKASCFPDCTPSSVVYEPHVVTSQVQSILAAEHHPPPTCHMLRVLVYDNLLQYYLLVDLIETHLFYLIIPSEKNCDDVLVEIWHAGQFIMLV